MNTSQPIGVLDSGFGGLSIYTSIVKLLPCESTVYIGDHAYIPYGGKTTRHIQYRVKKLITFLRSHDVKLIVVACNTATVAGIDVYRRWFPDIPIVGVVPVVKTGAEESKKHSFALLSTAYTAKSAYQKLLIQKFGASSRVYNLGCPNLLSYVEQGVLQGPHIDHELRSLLTSEVLRSIDIVVLGCTHYPFLRKAVRAIVGTKVRILDSGGAVARQVQRILLHNRIAAHKRKSTHVFYSTGRTKTLSRVASTLLGEPVRVDYAHI